MYTKESAHTSTSVRKARTTALRTSQQQPITLVFSLTVFQPQSAWDVRAVAVAPRAALSEISSRIQPILFAPTVPPPLILAASGVQRAR